MDGVESLSSLVGEQGLPVVGLAQLLPNLGFAELLDRLQQEARSLALPYQKLRAAEESDSRQVQVLREVDLAELSLPAVYRALQAALERHGREFELQQVPAFPDLFAARFDSIASGRLLIAGHSALVAARGSSWRVPLRL
jgi:hypothetical protein